MKTRLPPAHADSLDEREEAKAEQNFGQIGFFRIVWAAPELLWT
jgi:hypothetical protein